VALDKNYAVQAVDLEFLPIGNDPPAFAYHQYEWCIQEIGDFSTRVFLTEDIVESTKQDALEGFKTLSLRGEVVDSALNMPVVFR
jgi:hypothetical protein